MCSSDLGCFAKNNYQATSVSKILIYQLAQVIAKVYHTTSNIHFYKRDPKCIIEEREVNQRDTWGISFKKHPAKQDKSVYIDGYLWSPVRTNERVEYQGAVYNLEVEEDNSYTANNIIVHNCTRLSVAGKHDGFDITFECYGQDNSKKPHYTNVVRAKDKYCYEYRENCPICGTELIQTNESALFFHEIGRAHV